MAVTTCVMYRINCDFPECGRCAQDDGEYYAWSEIDSAIQEARDCGWFRGPGKPGLEMDGEAPFFCDNHVTLWASDAVNDDVDLHTEEWPRVVLDDISEDPETTAYVVDSPPMLVELLARMEAEPGPYDVPLLAEEDL